MEKQDPRLAVDIFRQELVALFCKHSTGGLANHAEDYAQQLVENGFDDWFVAGHATAETLQTLGIPMGHAAAMAALIADRRTTEVNSQSRLSGRETQPREAHGSGSLQTSHIDNLPFESATAATQNFDDGANLGVFESDNAPAVS